MMWRCLNSVEEYFMEYAFNIKNLCQVAKNEETDHLVSNNFSKTHKCNFDDLDTSRNFYHSPALMKEMLEKNVSDRGDVQYSNGSCDYYTIFVEVPTFSAIAAPILVVFFLFFCIILIAIFMKKTIRCPASILLAGIAMSDVLFASSLYVCMPYLYVYYNDTPLSFPFCVIEGFLEFTAFTFHSCSVSITTMLGLQKMSAVICPFHNKLCYTKKTSFICIILIYIICFTMFTPVFVTREYYSAKQVGCHGIDPSTCIIKTPWEWPSDVNRSVHLYLHLTKCVIFEIVPCIITLFASVYLTLTLRKHTNDRQITHSVFFRRNGKSVIRCHMSQRYEAKQRRSTYLIILILAIFMIAELPNVVLSSLEFYSWLYRTRVLQYKTKWIVNQVHNFILLLKVIADMVIYIMLSEHFRSEIKLMASKLFVFRERCR